MQRLSQSTPWEHIRARAWPWSTEILDEAVVEGAVAQKRTKTREQGATGVESTRPLARHVGRRPVVNPTRVIAKVQHADE